MLLRTDRILINDIYWFFYRLPPSDNMNDKGMRGGIITKADFNEIRRNQQALINQNKIQNRDDITLGTEERKFSNIQVRNRR
jgi:hypothetical protein